MSSSRRHLRLLLLSPRLKAGPDLHQALRHPRDGPFGFVPCKGPQRLTGHSTANHGFESGCETGETRRDCPEPEQKRGLLVAEGVGLEPTRGFHPAGFRDRSLSQFGAPLRRPDYSRSTPTCTEESGSTAC